MSATASFYAVSGNVWPRLSPQRHRRRAAVSRRARYTFREILRDASRQLETFTWSGWVCNTLDPYLENRHHFGGVQADHIGHGNYRTRLGLKESRSRGSYGGG